MSIPSFGIDIRKLRTEICFAGGGYFQYPSKIRIFVL